MSAVSVKLDGLDELRSQLEKLVNSDEIKKIALEKSGEHLRSAIFDLAPVRRGPSGGKLKDSIVKSEVEDGKIFIGPSRKVNYRAHFPEFGTSTQSARPYIRPAFEQQKSRIEQIMAEEIRKGLGI